MSQVNWTKRYLGTQRAWAHDSITWVFGLSLVQKTSICHTTIAWTLQYNTSNATCQCMFIVVWVQMCFKVFFHSLSTDEACAACTRQTAHQCIRNDAVWACATVCLCVWCTLLCLCCIVYRWVYLQYVFTVWLVSTLIYQLISQLPPSYVIHTVANYHIAFVHFLYFWMSMKTKSIFTECVCSYLYITCLNGCSGLDENIYETWINANVIV